VLLLEEKGGLLCFREKVSENAVLKHPFPPKGESGYIRKLVGGGEEGMKLQGDTLDKVIVLCGWLSYPSPRQGGRQARSFGDYKKRQVDVGVIGGKKTLRAF